MSGCCYHLPYRHKCLRCKCAIERARLEKQADGILECAGAKPKARCIVGDCQREGTHAIGGGALCDKHYQFTPNTAGRLPKQQGRLMR